MEAEIKADSESDDENDGIKKEKKVKDKDIVSKDKEAKDIKDRNIRRNKFIGPKSAFDSSSSSESSEDDDNQLKPGNKPDSKKSVPETTNEDENITRKDVSAVIKAI